MSDRVVIGAVAGGQATRTIPPCVPDMYSVELRVVVMALGGGVFCRGRLIEVGASRAGR